MRNEIVAELHERNVKFNCNAQAKYSGTSINGHLHTSVTS